MKLLFSIIVVYLIIGFILSVSTMKPMKISKKDKKDWLFLTTVVWPVMFFLVLCDWIDERYNKNGKSRS